MTLHTLAADQRFLLAVLFTLSAAAKVAASQAEVGRTGVAVIVQRYGGHMARSITALLWFAGAAVEFALAALLLSHLWPAEIGSIGVALSVAFVTYLGWLIRSGHNASCGCVGTAVLPGVKGVLRALFILGSFLLYAAAGRHQGPVTRLVVLTLVLETVVIVYLSEEVRPWLRRARLAGARWSAKIGVLGADVDAVRARVEAQPFWREFIDLSGREPEFKVGWRDGRWYILEYSAQWLGETVTFVSAEYLGVHPPWIRTVVAHEVTDREVTLVATWDSVAAAQVRRFREQAAAPVSLTAPAVAR